MKMLDPEPVDRGRIRSNTAASAG